MLILSVTEGNPTYNYGYFIINLLGFKRFYIGRNATHFFLFLRYSQ